MYNIYKVKVQLTLYGSVEKINEEHLFVLGKNENIDTYIQFCFGNWYDVQYVILETYEHNIHVFPSKEDIEKRINVNVTYNDKILKKC